jgi:2-polyprenyl-3-methyl-5-hydroxy-6-metoxy-1,4-benzoquinol methylase
LSSIYEVPVDPDAENNSHSYLLSWVGYNKSVLEVGCSSGYLTKVMAERGCEVVGIEIDPEAAVIAEAWAERVVVGDIDEGDVWNYVKDESFDVVLLGDVLEHLRDPLGSLRQAVSKLKPSGYIVTSLPNIAHGDVRLSLMLGRFAYADKGLLDRTHVRFFTAESARQLHAEAGLRIVDIKRVIMPLFASEIGLQREEVDNLIVDQVLADPEAETYQFVTKCVRDNGTQMLAELSDRITELTDHVHHENVRTALLRGRLQAAQAQASGLERDVEVLTGELAECERARAAIDAEYKAVLGTRSMRLTAPLRWINKKLQHMKTRAA